MLYVCWFFLLFFCVINMQLVRGSAESMRNDGNMMIRVKDTYQEGIGELLPVELDRLIMVRCDFEGLLKLSAVKKALYTNIELTYVDDYTVNIKKEIVLRYSPRYDTEKQSEDVKIGKIYTILHENREIAACFNLILSGRIKLQKPLELKGSYKDANGLNELFFEMPYNKFIALDKHLFDMTRHTMQFQDKKLYIERARGIGQLLQLNSNWCTVLSLRNKNVGSKGARVIMAALAQNNTITACDLGKNWLRVGGARHVAYMLKQNKALIKLDLTDCAIGYLAACFITSALKTNITLKNLNLRNNFMGTVGWRELADVLIKKPTGLTELDVRRNSILDNGQLAILAQHRPSLVIKFFKR